STPIAWPSWSARASSPNEGRRAKLEMTPPLVLPGLTALLAGAADAAQAFVAAVRPNVRARIAGADGKSDRALADLEQHAVHGFGWYATYAELMRQVASWATDL